MFRILTCECSRVFANGAPLHFRVGIHHSFFGAAAGPGSRGVFTVACTVLFPLVAIDGRADPPLPPGTPTHISCHLGGGSSLGIADLSENGYSPKEDSSGGEEMIPAMACKKGRGQSWNCRGLNPPTPGSKARLFTCILTWLWQACHHSKEWWAFEILHNQRFNFVRLFDLDDVNNQSVNKCDCNLQMSWIISNIFREHGDRNRTLRLINADSERMGLTFWDSFYDNLEQDPGIPAANYFAPES